MNELERRADLLKTIQPATASQFGYALYGPPGATQSKPQHYARAGANALRELARFGLARIARRYLLSVPQKWESLI